MPDVGILWTCSIFSSRIGGRSVCTAPGTKVGTGHGCKQHHIITGPRGVQMLCIEKHGSVNTETGPHSRASSCERVGWWSCNVWVPDFINKLANISVLLLFECCFLFLFATLPKSCIKPLNILLSSFSCSYMHPPSIHLIKVYFIPLPLLALTWQRAHYSRLVLGSLVICLRWRRSRYIRMSYSPNLLLCNSAWKWIEWQSSLKPFCVNNFSWSCSVAVMALWAGQLEQEKIITHWM